jgi:hypothetical protein
MKATRADAFASLLITVCLAGCDKPVTDVEQDAAICDPAFLRDQNWANLPSGTPAAQKLLKEFPPASLPAATRWYINAKHNEYGSCARSACVDGKCEWHVKLIGEVNGKSIVRFEYDLAPRKVR